MATDLIADGKASMLQNFFDEGFPQVISWGTALQVTITARYRMELTPAPALRPNTIEHNSLIFQARKYAQIKKETHFKN